MSHKTPRDTSNKPVPKLNLQPSTPVSNTGWMHDQFTNRNNSNTHHVDHSSSRLPQIIPNSNQSRPSDGVFQKPVGLAPQSSSSRLGANANSNLAVARYRPLKEENGVNPQCMAMAHQQVPTNTPAIGHRHSASRLSNMDIQMRGVTPALSDMSTLNSARMSNVSGRTYSNTSAYLNPGPMCKERSWSAYQVLPDVGLSHAGNNHYMQEHNGMHSPSVHLPDASQHNESYIPQPRGCKRARSTSSQSSDVDILSLIRNSPSALKHANFAGSTRASSINGSPQQYNHFVGSLGHLTAWQAAMDPEPVMHERRVNNFMVQESGEGQENNPWAVYEAMSQLERGMCTGQQTGMANQMVITQPDPHMFSDANAFPPALNGYKQEPVDMYSQMNMNNMTLSQHSQHSHSHNQVPPPYPTHAEMSPYNDTQSVDTEIKQEPIEEPAIEEYPCEWVDCNTVFAERAELVTHLEKQHIDQRRGEDFTCFWSNCTRQKKPFNARYKLLIHMRVHSGERPNKCTFEGCEKAFSRLENLKIHLRSHTGERPYQCQYDNCVKAFSNSSDRAKHQRTHIDMKPYACAFEGCPKRYTDPSSLRKHVKSHQSKDQQLRKKQCRDGEFNTKENLGLCMTVQTMKNHNQQENQPPAKVYQSGMHFGKALSFQPRQPPPPQLPSYLAPENVNYRAGGFNPAAYKGSLLLPKSIGAGHHQGGGELSTVGLQGTKLPMAGGDGMPPPPPYPEPSDQQWQQPDAPIQEGVVEGNVPVPSPMEHSPGPPQQYEPSPRPYFSSELSEFGHSFQITRAPPRSFVPQEGNAPLAHDYTGMPCHLQVAQMYGQQNSYLPMTIDETLNNLPFDTIPFQRAVSNHSGSV